MKRQKQWDKYEAVTLLYYYLKDYNSEISRQEVIQIVSSQLRKLALNRNIQIDNSYRNINRITFQMYYMESTYKRYTIVR